MAILNLDLSEYDSMRDSLKAKDSLISKYEKLINDLESKSRVILKTKNAKPNIDIEYLVYMIRRELDSRMLPVSLIGIRSALNHAITYNLGSQETSIQYIGFEDIEESVRSEFKDKINKELKDLERAKERYEKRTSEVETKYKESYEESVNILKEENKKLEEKIVELSKSKEEKIAELHTIIEKANKQLKELEISKSKFSLLNIFKKW